MTAPQEDPTRGDRPLLAAMPTVTIAGRTIRMRRLRYRDLAQLSRIIVAGKKAAGVELAPLASAGQIAQAGEALVTVLLGGFGYAESDALAFLARVLGVKREVLDDPDLFPPASLFDVVTALGSHPDVMAFFSRGRTAQPKEQRDEADPATDETSTEPSSEPSTD